MPDLQHIKLKVCGLRDNVGEVAQLSPDYAGFIFYPGSPRFVGENFPADEVLKIDRKIKRVGVFVNQMLEEILEKVEKYGLDYVQLHGDEGIDFCKALFDKGIRIIKVFAGNHELNEKVLKNYDAYIDFYLFDTRDKNFGGTGITFDWDILKGLYLNKPIFLSGGIDANNVLKISELKDVNIHAVDVNSKFEVSPGLKDIKKLKEIKWVAHGKTDV